MITLKHPLKNTCIISRISIKEANRSQGRWHRGRGAQGGLSFFNVGPPEICPEPRIKRAGELTAGKSGLFSKLALTKDKFAYIITGPDRLDVLLLNSI